MSNENNNELPIAKVRNLLGPMVSYFSMLKMIEDGEIADQHMDDINILLKENLEICQKTMPRLLKIIKDDELWG